MNKAELLNWYTSIQTEKLPQFIEATDANNKQLLIDGEWRNKFYSWTLLYTGEIWKYAETDSESGYVFDIKEFNKKVGENNGIQ